LKAQDHILGIVDGDNLHPQTITTSEIYSQLFMTSRIVTTDGDMRIGTNAPSGKLHVNGDAAITGNVLTTGLVGVGTTSLPERSICFSTNHSVFQTVEDGLKPEC
jgi:hypothetical protein